MRLCVLTSLSLSGVVFTAASHYTVFVQPGSGDLRITICTVNLYLMSCLMFLQSRLQFLMNPRFSRRAR